MNTVECGMSAIFNIAYIDETKNPTLAIGELV
jgi:hypothetical protein